MLGQFGTGAQMMAGRSEHCADIAMMSMAMSSPSHATSPIGIVRMMSALVILRPMKIL